MGVPISPDKVPGVPNVGFRVPADPQGSNTRVRAEITPPAYPCLTASPGSKTTQRTTQGTRDLYLFRPPLWCNTLLQFVVWWIASGAEEAQYKGRTASRGSVLGWCDELLGGVHTGFILVGATIVV